MEQITKEHATRTTSFFIIGLQAPCVYFTNKFTGKEFQQAAKCESHVYSIAASCCINRSAID